ncbi:MAG: hypothetical protein V1738_05330 [Patescibacteria group bacterium]
MRSVMTLTMLVILLITTSCAVGVRGGIVMPNDDDALSEPQLTRFVYDGARGTVEGVTWPDYTIATVMFGDVSIHPILYPGWTVDTLDNIVVLQNEELRAMIMIVSAEYPELEVLREARRAQTEGWEISDMVMGNDARHVTRFNFSMPNEREGAMWGLYTDYANPNSGCLVFGHWPAEHTDQLTPQIERVARNIVIRVRQQPRQRPS